jgi:hypothetical protein
MVMMVEAEAMLLKIVNGIAIATNTQHGVACLTVSKTQRRW